MVTTLGEISRESAKRFGDKTALIIEDKSPATGSHCIQPTVGSGPSAITQSLRLVR